MTVPKLRFPTFDGAWKKSTLERLIDFQSGYAFQSEYFSSHGKKLLTPKNFTKNGYADFNEGNTKYTVEDFDHKYVCKEGDLLLLLTDLTPSCELLGKPILLTKGDGDVLLNQRIVRILPKRSVSIDFLFYIFITESFHKRILDTATGSTVRHSSNKIISGTEIYFPLEPEQQKIADCLSSIDSLIAAETQKLDTLKAHKKGLMQQLFPAEGETLPKLRFPEFRDSGEWEEKPLGDVCQIQRGKFSHRPRNEPKFFGGKYPFIQTGDVAKANGGIVKASQSLNELGLTVSKLFKPTIVLITIAANIGDTGILDYEACFTDSVVGLIPNNQVSPYFLESVVRGKKDYLNTIAPQAAQKNINNEILRAVDILIPLFAEQQKIADCLCSLDDRISAQTQKIATLKTHKKGLMQQLFPAIEEVKE